MPIPVSVVSGEFVETVGAFNVNRVKDLIPTVQFYSTNPRNSAINIRGLGAPFGLTNDGIEPGVGLYIDGVFYARPAAATLDFLDVERIEVLRGPQGTLFGKNTTAGAINVTTRSRPSRRRATSSSTTATSGSCRRRRRSRVGSSARSLDACRSPAQSAMAPSPTWQPDAVVNDLEQPGRPRPGCCLRLRTRSPSSRPSITPVSGPKATPRSSPASRRRCAPNRQYPQIAADLGYTAPSFNAFDRVTDIDTPPRSYQDLGGASLNDRLESRLRAAHVEHGLAVLGLESLERSGLPRLAGDNDLGRAIETASVDAGSSLRRVLSPRLDFVAGASRSGRRSTPRRRSSRSRARRPRAFSWRRRPRRRRPACSTAMASTSTSPSRTSAPRSSAS